MEAPNMEQIPVAASPNNPSFLESFIHPVKY